MTSMAWSWPLGPLPGRRLGLPWCAPNYAFVVNEVNGTWHTATGVPGLAALDKGIARANAIIAATPLDALARRRDPRWDAWGWPDQPVTLRWIILHMIEETARHAGHLDTARELLDGRTGLG